MKSSKKASEEIALPVTPEDETSPRTIENPGDPGPPVLVPPAFDDPRENPKLPPSVKPSGV